MSADYDHGIDDDGKVPIFLNRAGRREVLARQKQIARRRGPNFTRHKKRKK